MLIVVAAASSCSDVLFELTLMNPCDEDLSFVYQFEDDLGDESARPATIEVEARQTKSFGEIGEGTLLVQVPQLGYEATIDIPDGTGSYRITPPADLCND